MLITMVLNKIQKNNTFIILVFTMQTKVLFFFLSHLISKNR